MGKEKVSVGTRFIIANEAGSRNDLASKYNISLVYITEIRRNFGKIQRKFLYGQIGLSEIRSINGCTSEDVKVFLEIVHQAREKYIRVPKNICVLKFTKKDWYLARDREVVVWSGSISSSPNQVAV
jgi:hypothetical protein